MENMFSGPHFWVLLVAMLYAVLVVVSIVRVMRLQRLSVVAKVLWGLVLLLVPVGGLIVFWSALPPTRTHRPSAP